MGQTSLVVNLTMTPACDHDGTISASVTGGIPPYTYYVYHGMGVDTFYSSPFTGLAGGYYSVQAVSSNSLNGYSQIYVTQPFFVGWSTTADTCGMGVGTATLNISGGLPPFTYLWSNGQSTITATGLTAGSWDCSITDANGCNMLLSDTDTSFAMVYPYAPFALTTNSTPSNCINGTSTVALAGSGTPPYTYLWDSNPVQTTQTATGLAVGSYTVTVTDAAGCFTTAWAYVSQGIPVVNITSAVTNETCVSANGAVTLSVSGGASPYTYLWNTGATTPGISGLSYGHYSCTVTDNNGCPTVKNVWVGRTTPLFLNISSTASACAQSTGTAFVVVTGGTGPYTYQWNTGGTTSSISGLPTGYYYVHVTDANGCANSAYTFVSESQSCYVTISGRVIRDANSNCTQDPGENGAQSSLVLFAPGGYRTTDANGNYSFTGYPGTYTISHTPIVNYSEVCPVSPGTITVNASTPGGAYPGNNFYDHPDTLIQDLRISMYSPNARPGFNELVYIYYRNAGTVTTNGTVTFTHDAAVNYLTSIPLAGSYNPGTQTMTWNLGPLNPGDFGMITVTMYVPIITVLGSHLAHTAVIDPISGDAHPLDNTANSSVLVTNSYDPNFKQVDFSGAVALTDTILQYAVNFQNTGTDTAFTVMISDTLDANLDIPTFVPGVSSHPYTWNITGQGIVEFTFNNILLPDSNINEPASHGFVTFHIEAKNSIGNGSTADNTGHIYFDYNSAIVTNTEHTLWGTPVSTEPVMASPDWMVFPNPSKGEFRFRSVNESKDALSLTVFSLAGNQVWTSGKMESNAGVFEKEISLTSLSSGIYFLKIAGNQDEKVVKLVIEK